MSKIKPGMTGYGKTVFTGRKIEKFNVRVVDVVPKAGLVNDDLILIRVSGEPIESKGGVSMGMSGSPVYIDGKLIGAVSVTFEEDGNLLGGVTPIESMRGVFGYNKPQSGLIPLEKPLRMAGGTYNAIEYCAPECAGGPDVLRAHAALAPVLVQGLNERAFRYLKREFDKSGVPIRPVYRSLSARAGSAEVAKGSELRPGDSIAVQLVRGDISIAAIGTLTAMEKGGFLAFGHPMFRKGRVKYLMTDAPVHDVVRTEVSYKMASVGAARGMITEDRGAAVAGLLDKFPRMIPLDIDIKDKDTGTEKHVSVKIVDDRDLLPALVISVLLEAMDNSIDRIGEGTSRASFKAGITGYNKEIERHNVFYSRYDISLASLMDIFIAIDFIMNNALQDTSLSSLSATIEFDSSIPMAKIEKAEIESEGAAADVEKTGADDDVAPIAGASDTEEPPADDEEIEAAEDAAATDEIHSRDEIPDDEDWEKETPDEEYEEELEAAGGKDDKEKKADRKDLPRVAPGEEIRLKVKIRPHRKEPVEEILNVKIPEDMENGPAVIDVYSGVRMGREIPYEMLELEGDKPHPKEKESEIEGDPEETPAETFEELVEDFIDMEHNNELVAVVNPIRSRGLKKPEDIFGDEEEEEEKSRKETPWVLRGSASVEVKIEKQREPFKEKKIQKSKIKSLQE